MPSVSVLLHVLFLVLLLVLLHVILILQLCSPLRTHTNVGTPATTEIKLSVAVVLAPGFQELAGQQEVHALSARHSNLVFLLDYLCRGRFLVDTGSLLTPELPFPCSLRLLLFPWLWPQVPTFNCWWSFYSLLRSLFHTSWVKFPPFLLVLPACFSLCSHPWFQLSSPQCSSG